MRLRIGTDKLLHALAGALIAALGQRGLMAGGRAEAIIKMLEIKQ